MSNYHSIIVNREVSIHGEIHVFVPYCFCSWKGNEYHTIEQAYERGKELHTDFYPKGQITK